MIECRREIRTLDNISFASFMLGLHIARMIVVYAIFIRIFRRCLLFQNVTRNYTLLKVYTK